MFKYINSLLLVLLFLWTLPVLSQTGKTISGTVNDTKGNPVKDVNIAEKNNPSNGTTTNSEGFFSIGISGSSATLIISAVNYTPKEVMVTSGVAVAVVIEEIIKGLDEVVVLGYGQRTKKITSTGAVSSITGAQIRQNPSASLQNALVGRMPGLFSMQRSGQPGRDAASITLRGASTFTGTTSPLIIVDDIEFSLDQLNQIDPNEVESLSILKDASTTAVYGVRGANGIILITTRRGKAGKPRLSITNETGFLFPTERPKTNDGYTTLRLYKEYIAGGAGSGNFIDPSTVLIDTKRPFEGDNLERYRLNDDPDNFPNVNWWDVLMKKYSVQNRINFDISGGTEKVRYAVTLAYFTQNGIFKNFSQDQGYNSDYFYNRYNFRSNLDINPTKSLKLRVDFSGRFGVINEPNDAGWNNGGRTFQYLWNGELSGLIYPVRYSNGLLASSSNPSSWKPNPVANLTYAGYNRTYNNDMSVVFQASQKMDELTKGLSADFLVSYNSNYNFNRSLTRVSSSATNAEILVYYKNANGEYVPTQPNLYRMGKLNRGGAGTGTNRLLDMRASLNYNRSFGKHNVDAAAIVKQTTRIDDVYSATNDGEPDKNNGVIGAVNYNYSQRYMVSFTGSYNGSAKFLGSKRYGFFPAVGAGWNISQEKFFNHLLPTVNYLKFRGSFGLTGNDQIGTSTFTVDKAYSIPTANVYYFGETITSVTGLTEPSLENHEITWEKQREYNVAVEAKFLNSRLSLTVENFGRYRYDILTARSSVPAVFGVGLPSVNLGIVRTKGYEIEIVYEENRRKLNYSINAQVTYALGKVVFRDESSRRYPWLAQTGKPVGSLFGYNFTGFYQDIADVYNSPRLSTATPLANLFPGAPKFEDLNKDGIIDQYDQGYMGTSIPSYTAGITIGFSYKSFYINSLFQGSFGHILNTAYGLMAYSRPDRQSVNYNLGRWTPGNSDNAVFPALAGGGASTLSSYWYSKADFVRWKNIQMGYNLPASLLKRFGFKTGSVYVTGYNMALIYSALPVFLDPESPGAGTAAFYPQQRILNLGVQLGL